MNRLEQVFDIGGQSISLGVWRYDHDLPERAFYDRAIERINTADSKRLGLEASGLHTAAGVSEKMAGIYPDIAKEIEADARQIQKEIGETTAKADRLALSGIDKLEQGDAVGAINSQAIVQWYMGLDGERKTTLHGELIGGKHREVAQAILRAPAVMTGLLPERKKQLQHALIDATNLEQLSFVEKRLERLEVAAQANAASARAVRMHCGLKPSEARAAMGVPSVLDKLNQQ